MGRRRRVVPCVLDSGRVWSCTERGNRKRRTKKMRRMVMDGKEGCTGDGIGKK